MTDLFFDDEARGKLLEGARKLYEAVSTTMGPKGRNVVIAKRGQGPTITHDGVTVAKAVHIKDEAENAGAEIIKEAANKLNDVAGDGTTTVTVLTYHLLKYAAKQIEAGANPMTLARQVEATLPHILSHLERSRQQANDLDTLTKIATISAGDAELGRIVAETVHKVGATGTIAVEEVEVQETTTEHAIGVQIDRGWVSPYMVTDDNRMEAIFEKPAIIIVHGKIYSFMELLPLYQQLESYDSAVIIAEDFAGDLLPSLILNSQKGKFRSLCIKAPSHGSQQRRILDDIASATGATVISDDTVTLNHAPATVVGDADKVIATNAKTTFLGVKGDPEARIATLAEQAKSATSEFEREQLERRQAALAGKVATIKVGGQTDTEIEEKKFRIDDAVAATKAALAEGILPGGGVPLYHTPIPGTTAGADIMREVVKQPFLQLIENANLDIQEAAKYLRTKQSGLFGYNVNTGERVNLIKAGIVDPYAVTREAVATAVSLGVTCMTAGALIVEANQ